jgi:NAD(P)H dehydrogenase (quinone)
VCIAVVYDSGSQGAAPLRGRTAELAKAIERGANEVAQTVSRLVPVGEVGDQWSVLREADAIVFGCPTYMGSASAAFKAFTEESFVHAWRERLWKDKLAAVFTNSAGRSGDKLATLLQLTVFAAQHGMVIVSLGEMPGHITSDGGEHQINRLSSFVGLVGQSDSDQGPDTAPPSSDRETARRFGVRIAQAAHRWARPPRPRMGKPPASGVNREAAVRLLDLLHEAQNEVYAGGSGADLDELLAPNITWTIPGENRIAGTYRGLEQVLDYFRRRRDLAARTLRLERQDVLTGEGDRIAALTDGFATIDGTNHRWSTIGLYDIVDGQIAACRLLPLDQQEFDAIWTG